MRVPNENNDGSFGRDRTKRRGFLRTMGLIGATAASGCSGLFLSNSHRPRGDGNETVVKPHSKRTASLGKPSSASKPLSGGSGTLLSGIYNGDHPLELGALDGWLGHKPAVVVLFVEALAETSWIETVVDTHMTTVWNHGHVPMLVWEPLDSSREQAPENIETRIANGVFDDTIETWATRLASWVGRGSNRTHRRRFYFLPAEEMNGNWYPWSAVDTGSGGTATKKTGVPEDYVKMWRRIHGIFSKTAMDETTIQWVWTPNADQVAGVRTERYYPGDEYVDWIGLNGYNYGDINQESRWRTPNERFGAMLDRMKALTIKPLCLPEVSTTSYVNGAFRPHRKAEWIDQLFSFADDEDIKMVCWYNFDNTGEWESDWAVFGGEHGTSSARVAGETYRAYDAYRRRIDSPSTLNARTDRPRVLTDDEFAGRF